MKIIVLFQKIQGQFVQNDVFHTAWSKQQFPKIYIYSAVGRDSHISDKNI